MEDDWFCIDEDVSSNGSFSDSDVIDSETEAELYSVIHYEDNLPNIKNNATENKTVQMSGILADKMYDLNSKNNCESLATKSTLNLIHVSRSGDTNNSPVENQIFSKTRFLTNLAEKLNTANKRKSDSDHQLSDNFYVSTLESNCHNSLQNVSVNKNKRNKINHNSENLNLTEKNCEDSNSSDSDSIIWTVVDSTENKDLQFNLRQDENEIYLSSDSESDNLIFSSNKNLLLKNVSMPNIKIAESSKDIWYINDQDLHRQKKNKSRRYHDDFQITCSNCNKKGHNARICPVPKDLKCFICGGGHHGATCVNRLCGRCGNFGHDRKSCWLPVGKLCFKSDICYLCNMTGHAKQDCPDLWRRYHLTTELFSITKDKQSMENKPLYCWNCGRSGHFGAVCNQFLYYRPFYTTWPCVVSYAVPDKLLKLRLKKGERHSVNMMRKSIRSTNQDQLDQVNKPQVSPKASRKKRRLKAIERKKKVAQQQQKSNISIEREKDFPRTPKKKSTSIISDDTVPEAVKMLSKKKQRAKIRKKNRRRLLIRNKKMEARRQLMQVKTENV